MTLDRNIRVANNPTRDVWLELLKIKQEHAGDCAGSSPTAHEIVAAVFGLITYDGGADYVFSEAIVQVLEVIRDKETFEFLEENNTKYLTYLLVVNHPMIRPVLNWGTSIRGAWFDLGDYYTSGGVRRNKSLKLENFVECPDEPVSELPIADSNDGVVELVYGLRMFLDTAKKE